jgi:hypothetical protein
VSSMIMARPYVPALQTPSERRRFRFDDGPAKRAP